MANPIPCDPPVREMIAVLIPITSPLRLINGPPLFPGLIAASVCRKSPKPYTRAEGILHHCLLIGIAELARVAEKKLEWIEPVLPARRDFFRCLHADHRREDI